MTRRKLFATLTGLPFVGILFAVKEPLPSSSEILQSFDARDWAKAFVAHVKQIPGLATDEATMTSWFANALMRGYDERSRINVVPPPEQFESTIYPCGCKAGSANVTLSGPLPLYCPEHGKSFNFVRYVSKRRT